MPDRTFESASIARRRLEEEFDRNAPSRSSGFLTWMGVGGLFAVVFVVCGGFGAFLGGRQLLLQAEPSGDGLAPNAAVVAPVRSVPLEAPEPVPVADEAAGAEVGAPAPEPLPTVEPELEPLPREPVRRAPPPVPEPPPEPEPEDAFDVETDDLIDVGFE